MVTDTIISALTNLFALFCSKTDVDEGVSSDMLSAYLSRHFGIRNHEEYINLYLELRHLYAEMPEMNTQDVVDNICKSLKGEITLEERALGLLRLMEFCCAKTPDQFKPDDPLFTAAAKGMGVPDSLLKLFTHYVMGTESRHVKLTKFDGFSAPVKTMWLEKMNIVIFTYDGEDAAEYNGVPIVKGMFQVWDSSGILRNHKGKPLYYSIIMEQYRTRKKKNEIVFSGRDINFSYPNSNNGIHNFSFDLRNGELIAIMGGSGSGKTTLVSILNGNIKPSSGTITINGHSIDEPETKALIGFVPQDDLLIEELTVYQNLYYTAKLCFEGMTEEEINSRVIKMLRDLGLEQAKDLKVGSPINKYISGGQRKRLNIALELIREPEVLFLDEPTSGLSSSDTEMVILLLKEQTYHGRLVITNIHQPSSDVYKLFDRLWMLDRGGYPVFDGNPIEAITYFKTAANYADAETSACPTCGNVNPEIMLNIIEERAMDSKGQLSDERKVSPAAWHNMYVERRPEFEPVKTKALPVMLFMKRCAQTKLSNRQFLAIALLEAPLLAGVCALLTHYAPAGEEYSIMQNKNLVSFIFMSVIVATFVGMSASAEEIIRDRALLKREKFLQLSYGSYIWSKIVLMAFVSILQTFLFVLVGNFIMGISGQFFLWWFVLAVTAILANLTGLVLSQSLSSVVSIYISIPVLLIPQILLCGLVVSFTDLTPNSTTGNVPLIGNVIPSRWSYEALAVTSYVSNDYEEDIFVYDKEKYEEQYYRLGFLYELQSAMERRNAVYSTQEEKDKALKLLKNEMPFIGTLCNLGRYRGEYDYASVREYLDSAEQVLRDRGNKATLTADRVLQERVNKYGREKLQQLKRDNVNIQLEKQLGINGNAPFYSSEKRLGDVAFSTLTFNMEVMFLMCCIVIACLLLDIPGKWMRKD